ncbi:sigma factor-like helix-turn-helix DNA-binding protein [Actinomadura oligospora]|uniref:sigma-70 region 4 domain-containing protein n=1 Tax=Actinomadura oligospora TaxID=111804 RepID=UPI0004786D0D|nr:sigma-70 region 4 domain-containing protein [Actinomadura oligospora]
MRGDPGSLYDAHAARLYAHAWSLLGDDAAAAVNDAFVAAVRHPPRGDVVLWMYALSRTAARSRGAFDRPWHVAAGAADPLLRAAAALRAEQREALLLDADEWLEIPDIAHVLGLAPDTVRQMLHTARARLERGVLDALMRGEIGDGTAAAEVIAAFEKGTLPRLLARRAPEGLPGALRDEVLESYEREADEPSPTTTSPSPLVVIGPAALGAPAEGTDAHRTATATRRRSRRTFGVVAGIAASAAAVSGLFASWSSVRGHGDGTIVPSARTDRTASVTNATGPSASGTAPGPNGTERTIGTSPSGAPEDGTTGTASVPPQAGGSPSTPATPPADGRGRSDTPSSPSGPGTGGTPPQTTPPSTPPDGSTPPTDPGTTGPTTPPSSPPDDQPEPSPAPSPDTPTPAPDAD